MKQRRFKFGDKVYLREDSEYYRIDWGHSNQLYTRRQALENNLKPGIIYKIRDPRNHPYGVNFNGGQNNYNICDLELAIEIPEIPELENNLNFIIAKLEEWQTKEVLKTS